MVTVAWLTLWWPHLAAWWTTLTRPQDSACSSCASWYGTFWAPGLLVGVMSAGSLHSALNSCLLQIIDEADRMIDSMHQSWLPRVVAAAFCSEGPEGSCALLQRTQPQAVTAARYPLFMRPAAPFCSSSCWPCDRSWSGIRSPVLLTCPSFSSTCSPQMPLQKLLFSATLTQNPEKLQQLGLYQPRLFSTRLGHRGLDDTVEVDGNLGGKYTFPVGLTVSM